MTAAKNLTDGEAARIKEENRGYAIRDHIARLDYCIAWGKREGAAEGRREGEIRGFRKGKVHIARNLLSDGAPIEIVIRTTGLDEDEIAGLRRNLHAHQDADFEEEPSTDGGR